MENLELLWLYWSICTVRKTAKFLVKRMVSMVCFHVNDFEIKCMLIITEVRICYSSSSINNINNYHHHLPHASPYWYYLCASFHIIPMVSFWDNHPIFIFRWGTKKFKICPEPHSSVTSVQIWLLTATDKFSLFFWWKDYEVGKWHVVCTHVKFSSCWLSWVDNNSYPLFSLSCPFLKYHQLL